MLKVRMMLDEAVLRVDADPAAVRPLIDGQVWERSRSRKVERGVLQSINADLKMKN